ncbi:MAG: DNA alkylation repair protein [Chitinophagaceae bacterium]
MHPYITGIEKIFRTHADPHNAAGAKAYLRNQFEHYGLPTPLRRSTAKAYFKKELPDYKELPVIIKALWQQPYRELHYFAVELLLAHKKQWKPDIIKLVEYLITHKSWWDTVDKIASEITAPYFLLFPEQMEPVTHAWNQADNFWLQRVSIIFQNPYKQKTNTELLSAYILHCRHSDEFFIQKAIGWALREYSKTNAAWVKKFVATHELPALSKREALKRISN